MEITGSTEQALSALSALAQESRLAAFRLLVEAGPSGLPAGEIAERLEVPPATLSFHLAQLVQARLLSARRLGRCVIYTANFAEMQRLMAYLTENCCAAMAPERADLSPCSTEEFQ